MTNFSAQVKTASNSLIQSVKWPPIGLMIGLVAAAYLVLWIYIANSPNYDSVYSLLWARELIDGQKPVFELYRAPTEHPLAILFALLLKPFGLFADQILVGCSYLSLLAIAVGVYVLTSRAFDRLIGLLAFLLIVFNWAFLMLAVRGYLDLTYMALVIWAAILETDRRRAGVSVLALLTLAGLLRPEGWLLAGLYALWMAFGTFDLKFYEQQGLKNKIKILLSRQGLLTRKALSWLFAGIVAPVVWCVVDFWVTGDPLFSLVHTSGLAEELERTRGIKQLPFATAAFSSALTTLPLTLLGVVGFTVSVWLLPKRVFVSAVLLIIGFGTFLLIGAGGFSVIDRYLLVPAALLMVFAAFAMLGWRLLPTGKVRTIWQIAGVASLLGVAVTGALRADLGSLSNELAFRKDSSGDLRSVASQVKRSGKACLPVWSPTHKLVADLRWQLDLNSVQVLPRSLARRVNKQAKEDRGVDAETVRRLGTISPTGGVIVVPASRLTLQRYAVVDTMFDDPADALALVGFKPIAKTTHYAAYARCSENSESLK